jgi:hypothetical protein
MRAVVQQAHGSGDESTDDESYHETDTDAGADGQDWHKGTRQNLSEKAKKAIEELRNAAEGPRLRRPIVLPIDVELKYDDGQEGDKPSSSNGRRQYLHILEDVAAPHDHVDHRRSYSPSIQPSERFIVPSPVSTGPYPESEFDEDGASTGITGTATFPRSEQAPTPENNSLLPNRVSPLGVHGISNLNGISGNDAASYSSPMRLAFPSKSQTVSLQVGAGILFSPPGP